MSQADSLRHIADLWDALTDENDKLRAEVMRLSVDNKTWVARFSMVKDRCDPECVHCAAWRGR